MLVAGLCMDHGAKKIKYMSSNGGSNMKIILSQKPDFHISAGFGDIDKVHVTPHTGIDIAMPDGTDLMSPVDGIISRIVDNGTEGLGKGLFIKMKDGHELVLGHLSDIKAKVGQHVHIGDKIADSGNTGYSTGPHLHVGLMDGQGHFQDPSLFSGTIGIWSKPDGGGFWKGLDNFSDTVLNKEAEWIFKPIGMGIWNGIKSIFAELTLYNVEIIMVLVTVCGIGMMMGPLLGSTSGKWLGRMFFTIIVGTGWRALT